MNTAAIRINARLTGEDARRFIVGPKFPDWFSRLDEKRFVVFEPAQ